ncbi:MAG: hypothetical protein HY674_15505 [Chloroflexi bacterium]|nr:hypothetical protein [Chloroflexota bacterium]
MIDKTEEPVRPGDITGLVPEFVRARDVQYLFGLKRGTLYNLLLDGKIKGCLLRVRGSKSGIRLFSTDSIRGLIRGQMATAENTEGTAKTGEVQ